MRLFAFASLFFAVAFARSNKRLVSNSPISSGPCASRWSTGYCTSTCFRGNTIFQPSVTPCAEGQVCCRGAAPLRSISPPSDVVRGETCSGSRSDGVAVEGRCTRGCADVDLVTTSEEGTNTCRQANYVCCANPDGDEDDSDADGGADGSDTETSGAVCFGGAHQGRCQESCLKRNTIWTPTVAGSCIGSEFCCKESSVRSPAGAAEYDDDASTTPARSAEQRLAGLPYQGCTIPASTPCGDRWVRGANMGPTNCVNVGGKPIATGMYCPLKAMVDAARSAGVTLQINSGFRTHREQQNLRAQNCRRGVCNPDTAPAGYSNHQNGIAVDISTRTNVAAYNWLRNNAHEYGFIRTVASETWHWEYRPGAPCKSIVKSRSYTCTNSAKQGI